MYNQLHSHFDRRYPSSLVPPSDRSYKLFLSDVTAVQVIVMIVAGIPISSEK